MARKSIGGYLPDETLAKLRAAYDRALVSAALSARVPLLHPPSADYVRATVRAFYDDGALLSVQNRERCLIALLATEGEDFALALHIYIAVMEGIPPAEVADMLFLVGIYAGAHRFAKGLLVEERTLETLERLVAEGGSLEARVVLPAIAAAFGVTI